MAGHCARPVPQAADIPAALAAAMGFQFFGSHDPQQQLLDYLREKEMLLCFDNFEHVLDGAPFVAAVLREAPLVKLLITSREQLRVSGEQVYALDPLPVGSAAETAAEHPEAVLLFADRASLVDASFALTAQSLPGIHSICEKLNGIPLAIELAAAWVDSFSLSELAAELDRQLELTARLEDTAERHRSLRASLDWSWNLLSEERRQILMQLSTFRGGCFTDAAEAVVGIKGLALRRELAALVDKSWLYTREAEEQKRFFLRDEVSREYAFEKLLATRVDGANSLYEQAALAHARYFASLVKHEGDKARGPDQLEALKRFGEEKQNIYEALDTLTGRLNQADEGSEIAEMTLSMIRPLHWYLDLTSCFRELTERFERVCEAAEQSSAHRRVLLWATLARASGLSQLGLKSEAREHLSKAVTIAEEGEDKLALAFACRVNGVLEMGQRNHRKATNLLNQALETYREINNRHGTAVILNSLGTLEGNQGNHDRARALYGQALNIMRELGDRRYCSGILSNLGMVESDRANPESASELFQQALTIMREAGDRNWIAAVTNNMGGVELRRGNYERALELFDQALVINQETGNRHWVGINLANSGHAEYFSGNLDVAHSLFERALNAYELVGDPHGIGESTAGLGWIEYRTGNLDTGRELLNKALSVLSEITDPSTTVRALNGLALLESELGHYGESSRLYLQALEQLAEGNGPTSTCATLGYIGRLLLDCGRPDKGAVCLWGADHQAALLTYLLYPYAREQLDLSLELLDHPETGLSAEERERLKSQAEGMSLDELAEFAREALETLELE